jgi:hypothetical protein
MNTTKKTEQKTTKSSRLCVRFTPQEEAALREEAKRTQKARGEVLRFALHAYMVAQGRCID